MKLALAAAAAATIALAGCQTDAQVRASAPLASYTSEKSPDELVGCLTQALTSRWNASPAMENQRFVGHVIAPGSEYDVVPANGMINGHYTFSVNVKSEGSGATVKLYQGQMMLPGITSAMRQGVLDCV